MCVNYRPSRPDVIHATFDLRADFDYSAEAWKGYSAPIVLSRPSGLLVKPAHFGVIPPWCASWPDAKKLSGGTLNARSETAPSKPSFRDAWQKSRFCLVPMSEFYEPYYESGKAERYRVTMTDSNDFCAGGLWSWWVDPANGEGMVSFSLLTLNCDEHPILRRLHKPDDEKRTLFIVPPSDYSTWLTATPDEARSMLALPDPARVALSPAPKSRTPSSERPA